MLCIFLGQKDIVAIYKKKLELLLVVLAAILVWVDWWFSLV